MTSLKKLPLWLMAATAVLTTSCSTVAQTPGANIEEQRRITALNSNQNNSDRLGNLIRQADESYQTDQLSIEQRTRIRPANQAGSGNYNNQGMIVNNLDFNQWLNVSPFRANEVAQYQRYLAGYVGMNAMPPMDQLLTTARSWERCGYEPFQLPPRELWSNMVMTLKLYHELKSQNILPPTTEIRSVYRSPDLNACAGGARTSKHMTNGAIDVWVPEYDGQPWYINPMQDKLCRYWDTQGESVNFGLGLYATGSIHIDTQGYRVWGAQHSAQGSYCRYLK